MDTEGEGAKRERKDEAKKKYQKKYSTNQREEKAHAPIKQKTIKKEYVTGCECENENKKE